MYRGPIYFAPTSVTGLESIEVCHNKTLMSSSSYVEVLLQRDFTDRYFIGLGIIQGSNT